MSVSEYIEKTELAAKVEAAVNEAVKARPDEPLSFLVSVCVCERERGGAGRLCPPPSAHFAHLSVQTHKQRRPWQGSGQGRRGVLAVGRLVA
jgi:hypothetical protein